MVNAQDFTYSKGYLGLLSTLGVSLGIIFCCAPVVPFVYHHYRPPSPEPSLARGSDHLTPRDIRRPIVSPQCDKYNPEVAQAGTRSG